ncbi:substrate-binding periplasmic protein [Atopomonas sediminilitoris]|uniref:substrate-binding periplasmic protein n=1 Tax=Atopomonas sediminilitoris TaxID=2919919 RepID=UPI001F4D3A66|nr:transporter substrate-binding domain-containing protein [Atopomonas sediminilitoris]MCJ8169383.1 transporter substrate-binding domain-containing protein [Atopomonas sediminilitoris]
MLKLLMGVALWAGALLSAPSQAAAVQDVLLYADDGYPPYSFSENGEASGFYALILRRAFSRMPNYRVTLQPMPWKRALKAVEQGDVMGMYPPYWHPTARPYMWPYSVPLFEESVALFCHPEHLNTQKSLHWPDSFAGLRIGVNTGYDLGGERYKALRQREAIHEINARSTELSLMMLAKGRSDCYLNDRLSTRLEIERFNHSQLDPALLKRTQQLLDVLTVSKQATYVGFTRRQRDRYPYLQDFLEQLNDQLLTMHGNGEIYQLAKDYVHHYTLCPSCNYLLREP